MIRHRRGLFALLALLLALIFAVSGCGGSKQEAKNDKPAKETSVKETSQKQGGSSDNMQLSIATGGTSGTYYYIGAGMSKMFSQHYSKINLSAEVTAAGMENIRLLYNKKVDIAISDALVMTLFNEKQPGGLDDVRQITGGHSMFMHLIVPDDSPIKSIKDLKGKRVVLGAAGSGNYVGCVNLLDMYGITTKDIKPMLLNYSEAVSAFKDGQVDCFMLITGVPAVAMKDLETTRKVRLLELESDVIERIEKGELVGSFIKIIKANTYNNQTKDLVGMGSNAQLLVGKEMPEDLAYAITKTIAEQWQVIKESHPAGAEWSPEVEHIFRGGGVVSFHPGAVKYWKEVGTWEKKPPYIKE